MNGSALKLENIAVWAPDSSYALRAIDLRRVCSAERRSYYPQYMQQVYDTDLNMLLICTDPAKRVWRDTLGRIV